ncbi:DNA excision repair protein ERCC-8 [Moelleriella libera RCEF 2490]|uniref:DNA excision repair protein ERCC-8 n=1 Tax=Moelleriella libera RCEF 2490 TaxID=1081109 RepID=A0A166VDZ4_9HYPO|nr:DNA excision repair protein ERCC-8 [Moelleriella libera RCEF 2490]
MQAQARLLSRETGDATCQDIIKSFNADLVRAFAPAPQHRFNGEASSTAAAAAASASLRDESLHERAQQIRAHGPGVSSLALDKFDGRILVSGGSDGSIKIWDLEEALSPHQRHTFRPVSSIARSPPGGGGHSHGITHLAFYPFDADAFLSSAYDKTLKLWAVQHCSLSAEFDLNATIYSHAMSPVAAHVLVACATQHSNVRLVDLKSGSAVQALVSHGGPVLCASWSPRHEHILASGHADGKVRIWDVRRAGGVVAQLDQEDSLGVVHRYRHAMATAGSGDGHGAMTATAMPRFRQAAQAHDEAVNALQWTDDGKFIVSAGLDSKIRVWDAGTGANTLASFGAVIQNNHAKTATMVVTPSGLLGPPSRELVVWPNDQEIVVLDLHQGNVVTRLRSPGSSGGNHPRGNVRSRITAIVWRGCGGGIGHTGSVMGGANALGAIYSAHLDGQIRAWMPKVPGPEDVDELEGPDEDEEAKRRKRKAVDSAYRSLMGRQITFTGRSSSA